MRTSVMGLLVFCLGASGCAHALAPSSVEPRCHRLIRETAAEPAELEQAAVVAQLTPPGAAESPPASATLPAGRYWFRDGECSPLDVRVLPPRAADETRELSIQVSGSVHSRAGTVYYLARDQDLVGAGFRDVAAALERGCFAPAALVHSPSGDSFGGVALFADRAACEAPECSGDACLSRFELGDCAAAVALSARRLRAFRSADEAARLRTLERFGRIGRRGRLWRAGESGCVAVVAVRDEAMLELRYTESVEGGQSTTTERFSVAPLDSHAELLEYTTIFEPTGGGIGGIGHSAGRGVSFHLGDGVLLLGVDDYYFDRARCEQTREVALTSRGE